MNSPSNAAEAAMRTLVIGHSGLLGSAVVRALSTTGTPTLRPMVRWSGPERDDDLATAFESLVAAGDPWRVFWCAGSGVPSTPQSALDDELLAFRRFCDLVAESGRGGDGSLFFASSAGALYAGAPQPPFTEDSPVRPLAPYGHAKLEAERVASGLTHSGVRVAIGRISNLYGPGQKLTKPQGLISQLCLSIQTGRPLGIYVPLDTLRDYLFVDDAAAMIVDMLDRAGRMPSGAPATTKILASGRSVSIAGLLGEVRLLTKKRPPTILAASPFRRIQARDLRMRSVVWPELDKRGFTPLAVGIDACLRDVSHRWRTGSPPVRSL